MRFCNRPTANSIQLIPTIYRGKHVKCVTISSPSHARELTRDMSTQLQPVRWVDDHYESPLSLSCGRIKRPQEQTT
jgi:hypothetical protein